MTLCTAPNGLPLLLLPHLLLLLLLLLLSSSAPAGAKVHWYGKAGMRKGRKIGHINIVAPNREEGRRRLAGLDPSAAASLSKSGEAMRRAMAAPAAAAQQQGGQAPQVGAGRSRSRSREGGQQLVVAGGQGQGKLSGAATWWLHSGLHC